VFGIAVAKAEMIASCGKKAGGIHIGILMPVKRGLKSTLDLQPVLQQMILSPRPIHLEGSGENAFNAENLNLLNLVQAQH
jgi:hypothetical protein